MPVLTRSLRYLIAALVLLNGVVHLVLYFQEYREVSTIGPLFLVDVVAAVLIAVALFAKPEGAFAVAALLFSVATLVAFVLSRTVGLFGFEEGEMDTAAVVTVAAEIGAIVGTALWFVATHPKPGAAPVLGERQAAST